MQDISEKNNGIVKLAGVTRTQLRVIPSSLRHTTIEGFYFCFLHSLLRKASSITIENSFTNFRLEDSFTWENK